MYIQDVVEFKEVIIGPSHAIDDPLLGLQTTFRNLLDDFPSLFLDQEGVEEMVENQIHGLHSTQHHLLANQLLLSQKHSLQNKLLIIETAFYFFLLHLVERRRRIILGIMTSLIFVLNFFLVVEGLSAEF